MVNFGEITGKTVTQKECLILITFVSGWSGVSGVSGVSGKWRPEGRRIYMGNVHRQGLNSRI